jgi:zinc transporter
MSEEDGLISAYRLNGDGTGKRFATWSDLPEEGGKGILWIHLDRSAPDAQRWLVNRSGLNHLAWEALLAEETRPRCLAVGDSVLLNLRGVNLNPESDPEDMVSIRMLLEKDRIVTSRMRRLMAIEDIRQQLDAGKGPSDTGTFVIMLASCLTARMDPTLDTLQEKLDALEDAMITALSRELRSDLAELRRETIMLRRYIAPQRDALRQLINLDIPWMSRSCRDHLLEIADRVTRYVEDLDSIRDRATVINDELVNRLSERMDRTMYVLSLVTTIFLPLTVISGMLGMNVGGIPGADISWGFVATCFIFVAIGGFEIWLLKRLKWWV